MKVMIIGPLSRGTTFDVHKADCLDIKRNRKYAGADPGMVFEAETALEVVDFIYGPDAGSFYDEQGGAEEFGNVETFLKANLNEFHFERCTADLGVR